MPFFLDAAILSRMRSPVTSRSNCAKLSSALSVSRPRLVVILNDCVKAGIAGLLMAGHNFCSIQDTDWAAGEKFVEALKGLSAEQWVRLLADYKPGVVKEVNPRLWTYIRNIVVRALRASSQSSRSSRRTSRKRKTQMWSTCAIT